MRSSRRHSSRRRSPSRSRAIAPTSLVLVVGAREPCGKAFDGVLELGVHVDKVAQLIGDPRKRDLVLATPAFEFLDATIREVHASILPDPGARYARRMRAFASDNYAPAHPDVLAALLEANTGHATAYGNDPLTARAVALLREHVGVPDADVHLVFNGTGANVVALSVLLERWETVLCAESAHINVDEGGAPERLLGVKLTTLPSKDGRITPEQIAAAVIRRGDVHFAQPRVVSITQSTEWGTLYTPDEIRAIADVTHAHDMFLHMDGARISNAAAALGCDIAAITGDVGVDALSFGCTKNGALGAEAVVMLTPGRGRRLAHLAKNSAQLSSKMRYNAAQFVAMFEGELWRTNALHANAMAERLATGIADLPGVNVVQQPAVNAVFVQLPKHTIAPLQQEFHFYDWIEAESIVRLVCSWDTDPSDVDALVAAIRGAVTA